MLHARTHFELRLLAYEECLRIEVFDLNSRLPIAGLVPDDATSGRGLLLVQALASSWGVETHGVGKIVGAELAAGGRLIFEAVWLHADGPRHRHGAAAGRNRGGGHTLVYSSPSNLAAAVEAFANAAP